jgi:HAD superfamily hydrolase (TIGR01549 family)
MPDGRIRERKESPVQARSWTRDDLKACLFDFGGTLDSDGVTWQDRFYALYEKHGVEVDREAFRQAFYYADDSLVETGEIEEAGLMETLLAQAQRVWGALGLDDQSRVLGAIVTDFFDGMKWHIERNRTLLELLGDRYELGIVSNFYGNLHRVCEDLIIQGLFHCLIDSSRVGLVKPDPRIFQAALDRMSIQSYEAVFVGDNPRRDMEGAKGLGMPHIWLAGEDVGRRRPCCPGDPVIPSLDALGPLLLEGRQADTPREVA